ncbi:MAG: hypothetical protein HGA44_05565 [Cellulomonadaceae bacterium]|nr:hypothetical protein [Cellulomonadaceae bacterium]
MGSTRIKGKQLALKFGTPAVDYWADTTKCEMNNEKADEDTVTFEDAAVPGGARLYYLDLTGVQSTDTASLWRYIWEHTGEEVPFTYAPHGNAVATPAQPHFVGTIKIGPRPVIGGEAGRDTTFTFDSRWDIVGVPVLDDGA